MIGRFKYLKVSVQLAKVLPVVRTMKDGSAQFPRSSPVAKKENTVHIFRYLSWADSEELLWNRHWTSTQRVDICWQWLSSITSSREQNIVGRASSGIATCRIGTSADQTWFSFDFIDPQWCALSLFLPISTVLQTCPLNDSVKHKYDLRYIKYIRISQVTSSSDMRWNDSYMLLSAFHVSHRQGQI